MEGKTAASALSVLPHDGFGLGRQVDAVKNAKGESRAGAGRTPVVSCTSSNPSAANRASPTAALTGRETGRCCQLAGTRGCRSSGRHSFTRFFATRMERDKALFTPSGASTKYAGTLSEADGQLRPNARGPCGRQTRKAASEAISSKNEELLSEQGISVLIFTVRNRSSGSRSFAAQCGGFFLKKQGASFGKGEIGRCMASSAPCRFETQEFFADDY